jgi:hypothetical protein
VTDDVAGAQLSAVELTVDALPEVGGDGPDVHVLVGQVGLEQGGVGGPDGRDGLVEQVVVVEPQVAGRHDRPDAPVEDAQEVSLAVGRQPGVDVLGQQLRLLLGHALVVGARDAELLAKLLVRDG